MNYHNNLRLNIAKFRLCLMLQNLWYDELCGFLLAVIMVSIATYLVVTVVGEFLVWLLIGAWMRKWFVSYKKQTAQ